MEEEPKKPIKFPITFPDCPICGCKERVAQSIIDERGKILGKEAIGCCFVSQAALVDPNRPAFVIPVLVTYMDICADCGNIYCFRAEKITGHQKPKGMPSGGLQLPPGMQPGQG